MRKTELDLCRIFGCLAVLMIHAGADIYNELPLESFSFAAVNFLSTAVRGGVPLFFMLTGALFLTRPTLDLRRMLVRHALRLTGLFYLWSLFYAALRALEKQALDPKLVRSIFEIRCAVEEGEFSLDPAFLNSLIPVREKHLPAGQVRLPMDGERLPAGQVRLPMEGEY